MVAMLFSASRGSDDNQLHTGSKTYSITSTTANQPKAEDQTLFQRLQQQHQHVKTTQLLINQDDEQLKLEQQRQQQAPPRPQTSGRKRKHDTATSRSTATATTTTTTATTTTAAATAATTTTTITTAPSTTTHHHHHHHRQRPRQHHQAERTDGPDVNKLRHTVGVFELRQGRSAAAAAVAKIAGSAPMAEPRPDAPAQRGGDRQYGLAATSSLKDTFGRRSTCAGSQCFTAVERWCRAAQLIAAPHHAEAPSSARQAGAPAAARQLGLRPLLGSSACSGLSHKEKELGGPGARRSLAMRDWQQRSKHARGQQPTCVTEAERKTKQTRPRPPALRT